MPKKKAKEKSAKKPVRQRSSSSKKPKSKVRSYDNSARNEKTKAAKAQIIQTMVELLKEKKGGEVPMEEIAQRSGISQRTIFRFFKDKAALHEATSEYLNTFLKASMEQMNTMSFLGFAQNAFRIFDRYESLVLAYIYSPFGQQAREIFRKQLGHAMIASLTRGRKQPPTLEEKKKLALIVSLVSAKLWNDIRNDFGFSGHEMADTVSWAVATLLKEINSTK